MDTSRRLSQFSSKGMEMITTDEMLDYLLSFSMTTDESGCNTDEMVGASLEELESDDLDGMLFSVNRISGLDATKSITELYQAMLNCGLTSEHEIFTRVSLNPDRFDLSSMSINFAAYLGLLRATVDDMLHILKEYPDHSSILASLKETFKLIEFIEGMDK